MGAGEKKPSRAVTHMCRMRSLANDDTCVHTGGSKAKEPSCRGKRGMQRESEGGQREGRRGGWVGWASTQRWEKQQPPLFLPPPPTNLDALLP